MISPAISTARIFLAPKEINEAFPAANRVYRLKKQFMAVHFDRGGNGQIALLPKGVELEVVGISRLPDCIEVRCEGRRYSVFEVDLLGPWSKPVDPIAHKTAQVACT
jgi:hypothetical protein